MRPSRLNEVGGANAEFPRRDILKAVVTKSAVGRQRPPDIDTFEERCFHADFAQCQTLEVSVHLGIATPLDSAMSDQPIKLIRFLEERYWSGSLPVVGFAAKESVEALISADEMSALFGGYLEYQDVSGSNRYLGVWGDRKVSQFLRELRARGAAVELEASEPSRFRQRHRRSQG
jgi:hypothetical protein